MKKCTLGVQYLSNRAIEDSEDRIYCLEEKLKVWILKFQPLPKDNAADHIATLDSMYAGLKSEPLNRK